MARKLKTLHEIINELQVINFMQPRPYQKHTTKNTRPLVNTAIRCDVKLREDAAAICNANYVCISAFLRECLMHLVSEYTGMAIGSKEWIEQYGHIISTYENE